MGPEREEGVTIEDASEITPGVGLELRLCLV